MRAKRLIKRLACRDTFEVKAVGKDTYVQGWANKAVVDRGKDLIRTDAWNLENYKKVPTILFNHDKDKPIGKAVDVRPTDQGLWIKAKISNSSDPEISKIRDLVNEGMLNAFSVGFDSQNEEKDAEGVNNISQAELYEVSIVTLPMNQDSTFDVTSKSLSGLSIDESRSAILKAKGAWLADAIQDKMCELVKAGGSRHDLLGQISSGCKSDRNSVQKIVAGDYTEVSEEILGAFSTVLGLDIEDLKTLESGDRVLKALPPQDNEQEDCVKDAENGDMGNPEDPDNDNDEDEGEGPDVDIISITIPKSVAATADAAKQMAADAGYTAVDVQDDGDNWVISQNDASEFGSATGTIDLGDGVTALVGIRQGPPDAEDETEEEMPSEGMAVEPPKKPGEPELPDNAPPSDNPPPAVGDDKKPPEPPPVAVAPGKPGKPKPPHQMSEEEMAAGKKPPMPPHPAAADAATKPAPKPDASAPPAPPADPGKKPAPEVAPPKPSAPPAPAAAKPDAANDPEHQPHSAADAPIDENQAKTDFEHFQVDANAAVENGVAPAWADQALWSQAIAASQAAEGKVDYGFVMWWYMQHGGTKKGFTKYNKKDGISGGGDAQISQDDNPYLAQARQTNVLLGVLIEEFRQMCAAMQGKAIAPPVEQEPKSMEEESMEMEKMFIDNANKFIQDIERQLASVN